MRGVVSFGICGIGPEPGSPPPLTALRIRHRLILDDGELTFTASSERSANKWMKSLHAAIRAPTHALLSYKGRAIFDAEDALAIQNSQQALRGFVSQQFDRIAQQKKDVTAKLTEKKVDIKNLKALRRSWPGSSSP